MTTHLMLLFNLLLVHNVICQSNAFFDAKTDDSFLSSSLPINFPNPDLYKSDNLNAIDNQINSGSEFTGEQQLFPYVPEEKTVLNSLESNLQYCYDKVGRAQVETNKFIFL